jgi:hypothetical protein
MASARQIAANRRNAQQSTGPRSEAGKKRASRNAYRHGLAACVEHCDGFTAEIEALASDIAAAATGSVLAAADAEILEYARTAAQAERELARIRTMKAVAMSALMAAASLPIATVSLHVDVDLVVMSGSGEPLFEGTTAPALAKPTASEPTTNTDTARRSLTDLLILDRYEQRAVARRDRAVLHIVARFVLMTVINSCNWRNAPNPIRPVTLSVI